MPPFPPISRRSQLQLMGGGLALAAAPSATVAEPAPDLADPVTKLDTYLRLRNRGDGKPSFMQYRGTIFGKREGERAVPLFGVTGTSWGRATRLDPGHAEIVGTEAGYFTDLATGAILDRWTNPLNGAETTVKHYLSTQTQSVTATTTAAKLDKPPPAGFEYVGTIPPATVIGDQLWMGEQLLVKFPSRPKESVADPREYFGPFTTATSLATWTAPLAAVLDRGRAFVPCTLAYQTLGSWRPFMLMGSDPGLISWQMQGLKLEQFDQVEASLRQRVLAEHPTFLDGSEPKAP